ncbi:MAG: UDP-N-acetylglucosamine 1-carboxyvinyltransferase [Clostridiales bacterium]|nr:UDP-N-acetylglucosamine 1-carboxyvinyltransferase [Clostridiales bacterium]
MTEINIKGGRRLKGETDVSGAKNAVLPQIAALVGMKGEGVIYNCPDIADVKTSVEIIRNLGGNAGLEEGRLYADLRNIDKFEIPAGPGGKMRSAITFCGGLLGRFGEVVFSEPGGCVLGARPIDIHLNGFKVLGAEVKYEGERIRVRGKLKGSKIKLKYPSVGATQNLIIAACFAEGETVLKNPSLEPETVDLINFLNACGGEIKVRDGCIYIKGEKDLRPKPYRVMADRIEAGTFLFAAAMTGGGISLRGITRKNMGVVWNVLEGCGCELKEEKKVLSLKAPERLKAAKEITVRPYPGFPTDLQPQLTAMLSVAEGRSIINETVFEGRNKHIGQLLKMGADITEEKGFIINGVKSLKGAEVTAFDLRGCAALCLGALGAEGESRIKNAGYIFRGYENFEEKIKDLGGEISILKLNRV